MSRKNIEVKWIIKYGPKLISDREVKEVYNEKDALKWFDLYQEKNFYVDVYKETTTTQTEKLTK